MRKTPFLILLIIFQYSFTTKPKKEKFSSGIIRIDETTLADRYEVSVGDWMAFMLDVSNMDSMHLKQTFYNLMPDLKNVQVQDIESFNTFKKIIDEPNLEAKGYELKRFYGVTTWVPFNFPVKDKLSKKDRKLIQENLERPIVGITFLQVAIYIKWRNELLQNNENFSGFENYDARLPSVEFWDKLALTAGPRMDNNLNSPQPDTVNEKGCLLMRIKEIQPCENSLEGEKLFGKTSFPVYKGYFPDRYGLYNFFGNVAEMTNVSGIAKGGSYAQYGKEAFAGKSQKYKVSKSEPYIGFRLYYFGH